MRNVSLKPCNLNYLNTVRFAVPLPNTWMMEQIYIVQARIVRHELARKIEYFASKSAMDIEGLGESTVERLLDKGHLNHLSDIYRLFENVSN